MITNVLPRYGNMHDYTNQFNVKLKKSSRRQKSDRASN